MQELVLGAVIFHLYGIDYLFIMISRILYNIMFAVYCFN